MRLENQVGGLTIIKNLIDHEQLLGVLSGLNQKSLILKKKSGITSHSFGKDNTAVWGRLE